MNHSLWIIASDIFKHQSKYKSIRLNKEDMFVSCYSIVEYNKDEKNDHIDLLHMDMFRYPDTKNISMKNPQFQVRVSPINFAYRFEKWKS